jgi:sec-independent protein translocase protein TatA
MPLFIGSAEIILIVFVVLMLFGSKKIPEVARALGKGYREFQKATDEIKRELSEMERDKVKLEDEEKGTNSNTNQNSNLDK